MPLIVSTRLTHTRARTRKLLLDSAMELFDGGAFPSITELAQHAQVSRATAYRYFPTQSDLITAVVAESLGPILEWQPKDDSAEARILQLLSFAYPQMEQHEERCERPCSFRCSSGHWLGPTPISQARSWCAVTASGC